MILHVDMDAFYASVEEREQPALRGRPLIVGGSADGRGVVAAANYAARAFGVRSAMPTARALRLCPDLTIVRPRGALYSEVSSEIREIFRRFTPLIEPLSLDEAFLDVDGSLKLYGSAEQIGRMIKEAIRDELDLVASVGVAPNKFLAKLASDQDKPDGFTIVDPNKVQAFLDPLPVGRIWGVGKAAQQRLAEFDIHTVFDLRQTSSAWLEERFGKIGQRLWQLSHGEDNRPVVIDSEARSISHETTFGEDIESLADLEAVTLTLAEGVCFRLRAAGLRARTMNLKVRYHDFSTVTRSRSVGEATDSTRAIWNALRDMLRELLEGRRFAVRLVGAGVSNFHGSASPGGKLQDDGSSVQTDLFGVADQADTTTAGLSQQARLDSLADAVQARYGKGTLRRGKGLNRNSR